MRLPSGGIDVFYIDESTDRDFLVLTAIALPFMRQVEGTWHIVWEEQFENVRDWRKDLSRVHGFPIRKEWKSSKFVAGRGRFIKGKYSASPAQAASIFRDSLSKLSFLPDSSVTTVVGTPHSSLYGHGRLEAVLYALLQRMRRTCEANDRGGMVFFDEGHDEYRKLYRKAKVFLPTGSAYGAWASGKSSMSMPMHNFTKDGNTQNSRHSFMIQMADAISFSGLLQARSQIGKLTPVQASHSMGDFYDYIPKSVLNLRATYKDPKYGIVRV